MSSLEEDPPVERVPVADGPANTRNDSLGWMWMLSWRALYVVCFGLFVPEPDYAVLVGAPLLLLQVFGTPFLALLNGKGWIHSVRYGFGVLFSLVAFCSVLALCRYQRAVAERNLARVGQAIVRYQVEHGTAPDSLSQLVPQYIDSVPRAGMSVSERPLIYGPNFSLNGEFDFRLKTKHLYFVLGHRAFVYFDFKTRTTESYQGPQ